MDSDDEAGFTDLVRAHHRALRTYVGRRIAAGDVDDVVAEVLAAAWRHRDRRPASPELWLYRTVWNSLLHQFRSQRRRERLTARLSQLPAALLPAWLDPPDVPGRRSAACHLEAVATTSGAGS